jgi:hypothetical protein
MTNQIVEKGVEKITSVPRFPLSLIMKVYIGKPNTCMCGCAGKYYYSNIEDAEDWQLSEKDQLKNVKKVMYVLNKIIDNANLGVEVIEGLIYTVEVGKTQYSLYLLEEVDRATPTQRKVNWDKKYK